MAAYRGKQPNPNETTAPPKPQGSAPGEQDEPGQVARLAEAAEGPARPVVVPRRPLFRT